MQVNGKSGLKKSLQLISGGKIGTEENFELVVGELRSTFKTGKTTSYSFRIQQLKSLLKTLNDHEDEICEALYKDLKRPKFEAMMELLFVRLDLAEAIRCLGKWMEPERLAPNVLTIMDKAFIKPEPYGVALVIGTWNYPFYLCLLPLSGAISAGNCAVIKPSEVAPSSAAKIAELLAKSLDQKCYRVIEGGVAETAELLRQKFDYIFCTSSTQVGKCVMEAAAKHLTPVTLELGGKSPLYIDDTVDMKMTAKRVIWGKFMNAAQTCIAPDYILCSKKVEKAFITEAKKQILKSYGKDPKSSPILGRIVNTKHFNRLKQLLDGTKGEIIVGGESDETDLWISPTIVVDVKENDVLMESEIFGSILPIMTVDSAHEAIEFINSRPKALSLYVFTKDKDVTGVFTEKCSAGAISFNDVVFHGNWIGLPFGGVGDSGIGSCHGKYSFDAFSHHKGVVIRKFSRITETMCNFRYSPHKDDRFMVNLTHLILSNFHWMFLPSVSLSDCIKFALGMFFMYVISEYTHIIS